MEFGRRVDEYKIPYDNRPEIFGRQQVVDEEDNFIREERYLLLNATMLSLDEGTDLCRECGGVCYPAHIDRTSNGAVAILGTFPDWEGYTAYEISGSGSKTEEEGKFPILKNMPCVKSSDVSDVNICCARRLPLIVFTKISETPSCGFNSGLVFSIPHASPIVKSEIRFGCAKGQVEQDGLKNNPFANPRRNELLL